MCAQRFQINNSTFVKVFGTKSDCEISLFFFLLFTTVVVTSAVLSGNVDRHEERTRHLKTRVDGYRGPMVTASAVRRGHNRGVIIIGNPSRADVGQSTVGRDFGLDTSLRIWSKTINVSPPLPIENPAKTVCDGAEFERHRPRSHAPKTHVITPGKVPGRRRWADTGLPCVFYTRPLQVRRFYTVFALSTAVLIKKF